MNPEKNEETHDNEELCFEKLLKIRYPEGFICDRCGGSEYWLKALRRIIICRKCRKEVSPLSLTMFSRSHLPLVDWFSLLYMVSCSPDRVITANTAYRELNIGSYRTAWEALNKIRFVISENEPRNILSGTIEFDEMVISGVESDYRKISILGALEIDGEKRLSLQMVKNPDEMNIKDYIRKRFKRDVTIITEPEKLYIQNWFELNRILYKSTEQYYGNNFMNLHVILQDVRYGLKKGHHGISEKYLQRNLDEYVFIFNHNDDRQGAFNILLNYMVKTKLSTYRKSENQKKSILSIITGE